MSLQSYVDEEIKLICPIFGIRFGDLEDKNTWIIQFEDSATAEQRNAAADFLNSFVWDEAIQEVDRKKERDARYSNAPIYKKGYRDYLVSNPDATFCDYMDSFES